LRFLSLLWFAELVSLLFLRTTKEEAIMSRLHFKGGPWTNAEDQVLKAALAQYGLRDWERVASMLTKKTSAQCRERWENYLDPRLNIREAWSLEEEEKLVELQSLFPNKFRLIAEQLTRRTPTHYIRPAWLCEQRYLELKDEQEHYAKQQQLQGDGDEAAKQSLEAFMAERRRRRNARKTYEERAARADTVSGERFQQEMVDMATSRLANQDQKKGLRKERQRQLEEAAFLAKLESNREGIESGTLSLRQSKKMRKALEEDRQVTGLVDTVAEGDDDADETHAVDDDSDDESPSSTFEAIDMYEDQQQAGLVRKQRVLLKDLTGQQRAAQQRQMLAGEGDGEGDGGDGSRARAAITGVNHDLLRQLTAGPSSSASLTANAAASLLSDRPSFTTQDNTSDAQNELKSSLADLFASLPQAQSTTTAASTGSGMPFPAPLPPPPLKRPRETLAPVPAHEASRVPSTAAAMGEEPHMSTTTTRSASDSAIPDDLFSSLNLPPPCKHVKAEVGRQAPNTTVVDGDVHRGSTDLPEATVTPSPTSTNTHSHENERSDSGATHLFHFLSAQEEGTYVKAARQQVAVECERALTATRHDYNGSPASAPLLSPAEKDAVEKLVASELGGGSQVGDDAIAAVRAYVNDLPRYTARVNVQSALHHLTTRVAAQVREANALLQPLRQEWEQVLAVAMLHPRQLHVLQGYVREDGRLKRPAAAALAESNESHEDASAPSVAAYVYEHLVNELTRARQATRFLASLRDREQLKMRRDLDAAEDELQQLQAREKTLQDLYRQKRAQLQ
jgi:pre-mRNA-splicing factor CDC5/CEF1